MSRRQHSQLHSRIAKERKRRHTPQLLHPQQLLGSALSCMPASGMYGYKLCCVKHSGKAGFAECATEVNLHGHGALPPFLHISAQASTGTTVDTQKSS